MSGFIAFPRELVDPYHPEAWFPGDPVAKELYMLLVSRARWRDAQGDPPLGLDEPLKIGQLLAGTEELGRAIKRSRQTVRTLLKRLRLLSRINQQTNHRGTIITICDYEKLFITKPTGQPGLQPQTNQQLTNDQPLQNKETRKQGNKEDTDSYESVETLALLGSDFDASAYLFISKAWQAHKGNLSAITKLTEKRKLKMRARWKEEPDEAYWIDAVKKLAASSFCLEGGWANFDWLIANDTNHRKASEGKYDDKTKAAGEHDRFRLVREQIAREEAEKEAQLKVIKNDVPRVSEDCGRVSGGGIRGEILPGRSRHRHLGDC